MNLFSANCYFIVTDILTSSFSALLNQLYNRLFSTMSTLQNNLYYKTCIDPRGVLVDHDMKTEKKISDHRIKKKKSDQSKSLGLPHRDNRWISFGRWLFAIP